MIATCIDADGTLSGAAVEAAGIPLVLRYVGIGSTSKRLTVAERDDLLGHGRIILGIAESTVTEDDNGAPAGQRDAEAVLADPAAAGLPFVFMTNDKPTHIPADIDYAAAYTDVLGARSSVYGFAEFLKAARAARIPVSMWWQAGLPPNLTGTQGWVHLWQRQGTPGNGTDGPATPITVVIGARICDWNNLLLPIPGGIVELTDKLPNGATVQDALMDGMTGQGGKWSAGITGAWLVEQLTAISGALDADEAALLAAIKAQPAPVVQQITADPAAVATALESAGLPTQIITALLALLAKAAPTGGTA